jgi:hypothetical protein
VEVEGSLGILGVLYEGPEEGGLFLVDGEDAGDSFPWEFDGYYVGGGTSIDLLAEAKAHGEYGYKFSWLIEGASGNCYGQKSLNESALYLRMYLYLCSGFALKQADAVLPVLGFSASDYTTLCNFRAATDGSGVAYQWQFFVRNGESPSIDQYFSLGKWHCVELYFKYHATEGAAGCWIDGHLVNEQVGLDTTQYGEPARAIIGAQQVNGIPLEGMYFYIDDVRCSLEQNAEYTPSPIPKRFISLSGDLL